MQNPTNNLEPSDADIADFILGKSSEPLGRDGLIRAAELLTLIKTFVWRTNLVSDKGALKVYGKLEAHFDMGWILSMVDQYVYRIGLVKLKSEVAKRQAEAIGWMKASKGLPAEMITLSSQATSIEEGLANNPLLMFLVSLSMGRYEYRLFELTPITKQKG